MKSLKFSIIALLLISMVACKKEDTKPTPPTPDPNPSTLPFPFFKANQKWTYNTYSSSDPSIILEESKQILSIDNAGWAAVKWTVPQYVFNIEWYANQELFSDMGVKALNKKQILTTKNPSLNQQWQETWQTGDGEVTNTRKIVALSETVTVPAGTYSNCIKIRETTSDDPIYYNDFWFSIQHGIIKEVGTTSGDFPNLLIKELRSIN